MILYNTTGSFKSKAKIAGSTPVDNTKYNTKYNTKNNTKYVEIALPMKYSSNFWGTFEMSLINCEINLILNWSANCIA